MDKALRMVTTLINAQPVDTLFQSDLNQLKSGVAVNTDVHCKTGSMSARRLLLRLNWMVWTPVS